MAWDYDKSSDYIRKNAAPITGRTLLLPAKKQYSPTIPNLFIAYYSMPDWLTIFEVGPTRITGRHFDSVVQEYRAAAQDYQKKVADNIDAILKFGTGKALLKEIAACKPRMLRIMPHAHWKLVPGLGGEHNAIVFSIFQKDPLAHVSLGLKSDDVDAFAKGLTTAGGYGGGGEKTTGAGADCVVFYSPDEWKGKVEGAAADPDSTLFHELVHTTRDMRGFKTGAPVGDDYDNEEEYLATTITNMYLSETNRDLRGAYTVNPSPVLENPDRWFKTPLSDKLTMRPATLMEHLRSTQGDFYRSLNQLPDGRPRFNPVRDFDKSLASI